MAVSGLCRTFVLELFVPCCYCFLGKICDVYKCQVRVSPFVSPIWENMFVFCPPSPSFSVIFYLTSSCPERNLSPKWWVSKGLLYIPGSDTTMQLLHSLIKLGFSVVVAGSSVLTQLILVSNRLKCQCFNVLICGKKKIVGWFIYNLKRCCGKGLLVQDGKWQLKVQSSI